MYKVYNFRIKSEMTKWPYNNLFMYFLVYLCVVYLLLAKLLFLICCVFIYFFQNKFYLHVFYVISYRLNFFLKERNQFVNWFTTIKLKMNKIPVLLTTIDFFLKYQFINWFSSADSLKSRKQDILSFGL